MQCHPDKYAGPDPAAAVEMFDKVAKAWSVLGNIDVRRRAVAGVRVFTCVYVFFLCVWCSDAGLLIGAAVCRVVVWLGLGHVLVEVPCFKSTSGMCCSDYADVHSCYCAVVSNAINHLADTGSVRC